jgi:hypothetical protein
LKKKKMVWSDDPPEDPVISVFPGCLDNHDRAHIPLRNLLVSHTLSCSWSWNT